MKRAIVGLLALTLLLAGCESTLTVATPGPDSEPTPEVAETAPAVYTDWSQLTPYEPPRAKYTRRYAGFTDTLIPSEDYGPLVPFAGGTLTTVGERYGYDWEERLYGLTTLSGEVVVDPVFSSVSAPQAWDDAGHITQRPDVYILTRTVIDQDGTPAAKSAICARDGSWCTDFLYTYGWEMSWNISDPYGIPLKKGVTELALVDLKTGAERWSVDLSPYMDEPTYFSSGINLREGYVTVTISDWETGSRTFLCISPAGEVSLIVSGQNVSAGSYGEGLIAVQSDSRWGYMDLTGSWVIPPSFQSVEAFSNGVALVKGTAMGGGSMYYFIDHTGLSVYDPVTCNYYNRFGDYWYFWLDNSHVAAVCDAYGRPVDSPLIGKYVYSGFSYAGDGWVSTQVDGGTLLVWGDDAFSFPGSLGTLREREGARLLFAFQREGSDLPTYAVTDWTGNVLTQFDGFKWMYAYEDIITGETCLYGETEEGQASFLTWDGSLLFPAQTGRATLYNGYLLCQKDDATTLTNPDGEVVFCWPLADVVD